MRDLWAQELVWSEQRNILPHIPGLIRKTQITREWLAEHDPAALA